MLKLNFLRREEEDGFLHFRTADLLIVWLNTNDIWPDKNDTEVRYNSVYHFYDISIFFNPKSNVPLETQQEKIRALFQEDRVECMSTFRWLTDSEGHKKLNYGLRFWVYPKENVDK